MKKTSLQKIVIGIFKKYQKYISPLYPSVCRFMPTCSAYAITSVERFGVIKGSIMTFFRFIRCNPLCKGGYDPVPDYFTLKPFAGTEKMCEKTEK